ncbi:MAG: hypothetical protein E7267_05700 [Lachnospiraceae bacterium]|nr:hypothetical protein [Lachnospiraceae bacterium]
MADRRYSGYTDGNAARKFNNAAPKRRESDRREYDRRIDRERYEMPDPEVIREVKKNRRLNRFTTFITVGAIVASMYLCVSYIMAFSDITAMNKELASLRSQISDMQVSNAEAKNNIDASVDLGDVYKKATTEFGMVPADKNQVYKYVNKKSDRVIQYSDIPE